MIRLGLVGFPLEHSLSPLLHAAALRILGLEGGYSLYPVRSGDATALGGMIDRVRSGDLSGLNITIPHKQAVLPFLDDLTPAAARIGAVNTIYRADGRTIGDNTDAPGFLRDLDRFIPLPRSAIVLGAGGAARAVVCALQMRGCELHVAARNVEQAGELALHFPGAKAMELNTRSLSGIHADLIVNATPVGMAPHVDQSPWPDGLALPEGAALYDLIYNPPETALMRMARAAGHSAAGGIGMLAEQAALSFELWTGCQIQGELLLESVGQRARS